MRAQDGGVTCQIFKVVHNDSHKQVQHLEKVSGEKTLNVTEQEKQSENNWEYEVNCKLGLGKNIDFPINHSLKNSPWLLCLQRHDKITNYNQ